MNPEPPDISALNIVGKIRIYFFEGIKRYAVVFDIYNHQIVITTECEYNYMLQIVIKAILRINVCLDELFTNIVSYGFDDDLEHIIRFTLNGDNNFVVINIEDDGIHFNPLDKVDPDFPENVESAKIGGLGILIIRKLMDNVSYERKQGINKLTMRKNFQVKR